MKESSFESIGGLKIATRSWQPAGKPRAVMILIHGFNAHSAYMTWPAEQFAAAMSRLADAYLRETFLTSPQVAALRESGSRLLPPRAVLDRLLQQLELDSACPAECGGTA